MKFTNSGDDIPEDLIRDVTEGNALFLCGAGVSMRVDMPSFRRLTDLIYEEIGESLDNEPAERRAYEREEYDRALRSLEKRTQLPRAPSRVRTATAKLLTPPKDIDLSNHENLLHLSQDRDGRVRLLTTNFDPLFEMAALQLGLTAHSYAVKAIPRPGTPDDFGILHLHGRIGFTPLNLPPSDLILTSADFGDAYLRDGWASQYIEDRMRLSHIILIGYAAEDAALRLLLETMDADRDRFRDLKKIYALEVKKEASASIWKAKGIIPIEFPSYDDLYATVAEWSEYARDPEGYGDKKINEILG